MFATPYKRPDTVYEPMSTKTKTEFAGYVPAAKQIENLFLAGKRLAAHRAVEYDYPEGSHVDDDFVDPTRHPSYDLADASTDERRLEIVMHEIRTRQRMAKEERYKQELAKRLEKKPAE